MIAFVVTAVLFSVAQFSPDPRTAAGFDHFYNLEYDQAIAEFQRLASAEPENPAFHNHLAQAVLYREMLRGGALESELVKGSNVFLNRPKLYIDPAAQRVFEAALVKAMQLTERRIAKDPADSVALYAQGVSYALRANYNFLARKAWIDALKDASTARKAHNRVIELTPGFTDAKLIQGLHDYVLGNLPFTMKLLGFLGGFQGDRETGIQALQLVSAKGHFNKFDAQVLLAAIYRREKKPELALPLLAGVVARFPRNYLFQLETVQMYGDLGQKEKALAALARIEQLKRADSPGFGPLPLQKIHYHRGNLLFWFKELDSAFEELKKATTPSDAVDTNTAMMSWMRLGQVYDLKGKREDATAAYRHAISLAPQSQIAKESKGYLSSPFKRRDS